MTSAIDPSSNTRITTTGTGAPAAQWTPWWVALFSLLVLAPSIWSDSSVTGSDEYTLSLRTPMEMLEHGHWLTPWLDNQPRLRKPPLMYWLVLVNYKVFGVGLVAARIWGVLAGVGLSVVSCLTHRELFRSNGLLAGLITASCIGVAAQARQAMLDLPLAFFVSLSVLCGLPWVRTGTLHDAMASGTCLGLSFLTKGPIRLFFFGTAAVAALLSLGAVPRLRKQGAHWIVTAGIVALIAVPWPLAMKQLWGDRFAQILGEELAARDFGRWHGMAPLSALGGALGLIAPWTPMVLVAAVQAFRVRNPGPVAARRWLVTALGLSIVPFFFMTTFERYMLAVVPIEAVLAAEWLEPGGRAQRWTLLFAAAVFSLAGLLAGAFFLWFHLGGVLPVVVWLLAAASLVTAWRGTHPTRSVALTGLVLALVMGGLYPLLGLNHLPDSVPALLGNRPVFVYDRAQPAMLSPKLGRSVQKFRADTLPPETPAIVFVDDSVLDPFRSQMDQAGIRVQEVTRFKTFYSRRVWIRFARPDATAEDWRRAFRDRSLEGLKSELIGLEVVRKASS